MKALGNIFAITVFVVDIVCIVIGKVDPLVGGLIAGLAAAYLISTNA